MHNIRKCCIGQIFQLYIHRDRELTRSLVERACAAGFCGVCLTVDTPMLGKRERDSRNKFTLPPELELANFSGTELALDGEIQETESGLFTYVGLADKSQNPDTEGDKSYKKLLKFNQIG